MNSDNQQSPGYEKATFGGGCFWCLEPLFASLQGVVDAEVGYAGGQLPNPTYEMICTGTTGHAEVVRVVFDPQEISFQEILEVFFTYHDPTTLNRQGADVGPQYRSIILYHDEGQKATSEEVIADFERRGVWGNSIVTQVVPLTTYYRAEDYHQEYFDKNPHAGYCRVVIAPKVAKFRQKYQSRLKAA